MDNGHEPATKADLAALKGDVAALKGDLNTLEQRLTESLTETIRDSETHLLKSFYGFTESVSARFRAADDNDANLKK